MGEANQFLLPLAQLNEGERARVVSIGVTDMRRRLLDLGLIEGTQVECLQKSPFGDPVAFLIRGAVLALRSIDSKNITVEIIED